MNAFATCNKLRVDMNAKSLDCILLVFSIYVSTDLKTNTKRIFIVSLNGTLTLERLAAK